MTTTATYRALAAWLLVAPTVPPLAAQTMTPTELGRRYTGWFYTGQADSLWARFSPEMRRLLRSVDGLRLFRAQVERQAGAEAAVVREEVTADGGMHEYVRVARFDRAPAPIVVRWTMDAAGTVAGFTVQPQPQPAPTRFLDYRTRTPLRLPFAGEWRVVWGGRTPEQNYHVVAPDQRFAYDLLVVRDGSSHAGDGTRLEDYHCFGQPILAPGAGTVVVAVDSLPDNAPGVMDRRHPPGNHVIIDHGTGEFSVLAHLRRGSVTVKPGDRVAAGVRVGACGNSGNTSEPHLHYHLQTTGTFGRGEGLPAQFLDYLADGQPVSRGEPVRGQTIRPR